MARVLAIGKTLNPTLLLQLDHIANTAFFHLFQFFLAGGAVGDSVALANEFVGAEERADVFRAERRVAWRCGRHLERLNMRGVRWFGRITLMVDVREESLLGELHSQFSAPPVPSIADICPAATSSMAESVNGAFRQGQARQDTLETTLVQEQKFVALVSPIRMSEEGLIQLPGFACTGTANRLHKQHPISSTRLQEKKSQQANKKLKAMMTVEVIQHQNADAVLAHASRGISRMKQKTKPEIQYAIPHSFPKTVRDSQRRSCGR